MVAVADVPWLVIPTYNEAENLERVIGLSRQVLAAACPDGFRILVVDDRSPDGTGEMADRLAQAHPGEVQVLHRERPAGLGPAYLAGFDVALRGGATHVMEMDADLSHDPRDLARLLDAVRGGADLALGSRYVRGGGVAEWGLVRRLVSRGGSWYARRTLGLQVRDLTGGFKCFRADVLRTIELSTVRSVGYAFQVELTWRAVRSGFRVVEVPIVFRDRTAGSSKMHVGIAREAALLVPALRRSGWQPPPVPLAAPGPDPAPVPPVAGE
ncbi:polyprenol monophosphomannose synthase [Patulibacter brassicae]|jgi:dolichol-phosphate mannosyltransferase|uniref:Polyprenol monophosphomannose synthase n=1 Tax=Patulibacter brassicae TaxID=1705717 RepID=A0ABU4VLL5_9ACTN|nr:polyprenol monophosphomannose synthase [Patulibacter brassicae]MDX8152710.1 polyprenol monophosphomannose synthase [Patulibacter brassicae]